MIASLKHPSRRAFIQQTALAGAGLTLAGPYSLRAATNSSADLANIATNDVASIENSCTFNTTVYAWLRTDIPYEVGHTYWRDIHGTLISRIPGTFLYRQLHLSPAVNVFSQKFQPYGKPAAPADQPQGIAHTFYLNEAGRDQFFNHPYTKAYMVEDEVKLVRANATLWSTNNNARTLKDTTNNLTPQGKPANDEYAVSFIIKSDTDVGTKKELVIRLAEALAKKVAVTRVRYHLLDAYNDEGFPNSTVNHNRPKAVRYNAWLELGVQPKTNLTALLEPELADSLGYLDTIHIYPIYDKYTIMANGKATIVGLKGYPAYQTILQAGAENQLSEKLLEDIYGKVPGQ